jgi:hypothetical protein
LGLSYFIGISFDLCPWDCLFSFTHLTGESYKGIQRAINNVYKKINNTTRLAYIIIAVLLFFVGLLLWIFFFLILTIPFALATWAFGALFLYLAAEGRPYSDFKAYWWDSGRISFRARRV